MNTQSLAYNLIVGVLRLALVLALVFAGLDIYRSLPGPDGEAINGSNGTDQTAVQIVLQPTPEEQAAAMNIRVELFPIDISAVQREFLSERRPGVRLNDFLERRMNGKSTVRATLDERGQATVLVTPGKWWVHAVLSGAHNLEWRLPVNIAGQKQTIELKPENAYAKMKSF